MKYLRFLVVFLSAALVFASCQKELSLEAGLATGSLKSDTNGDCLPVLINGTYQKDTLLNATNYVDVQVNITQTGAYIIKTDTINGYSFSASGSVAVAGINTIRLLGSGRPVAPSLDVFTVKFDTTSCEINVIVTGTGGGGGGTPAVYTLDGSPTTCTGAVLAGTYQANTASNTSNTATISVNVSQIGTYSITSGTAVNGIIFTGAGAFTSTGVTTVLLTATGVPTASGSFNYPISSTTSNCSFSVTYTAAATDFINCTIDGVPASFNTAPDAIYDNTTITGYNVLDIFGDNPSNADFELAVGRALSQSGGVISTGTYTVNDAPNTIVIGAYTDAAANSFLASSGATPQTPAFTITITAISATRVSGTFSGPLKDNNGAGPGIRTVTNGSFSVPIN